MRNIDRIDKFCDQLKEEWKKYPEFRFGQMMMNILCEMSARGRDPFFPEEDEMIEFIHNYMETFVK